MRETITPWEYDWAWQRWVKNSSVNTPKTLKTFMAYIGIQHNFFNASGDHIVPSHAAHRIRMLLGPHYKAIIKAYEAKHGSRSAQSNP